MVSAAKCRQEWCLRLALDVPTADERPTTFILTPGEYDVRGVRAAVCKQLDDLKAQRSGDRNALVSDGRLLEPNDDDAKLQAISDRMQFDDE